MNTNQGLEILIKAVNIAQSKGAYTLDEARIIADAIGVFVKKEEPKEEPVKKDSTKKVAEKKK